MEKPRLTLILTDESGREIAATCWNVEREDASIEIPRPCEITGGFDEILYKFKEREFRTQSFSKIGARLGKLMAERLDDKEGWNGERRRERQQNEND